MMLILLIWSFFYYLVEVFWNSTQTFNLKLYISVFWIFFTVKI